MSSAVRNVVVVLQVKAAMAPTSVPAKGGATVA